MTTTANAAPDYPFPTLKINITALLKMVGRAAGKKYRLGNKPHLDKTITEWATSDCSGYVRWLLYQVADSHPKIPLGSWNQAEWCRGEKFKLTSYEKHAGLKDNRLRIAFIKPKLGKSGHVWLILNGYTIECYGGHGCGRRPWDTPVLYDNVYACFVLTEPMA